MSVQATVIATLDELQYVTKQLDTDSYTLQIPELSKATIGQHTRHIVEFFQCVLTQYPTQKINYDLRARSLNIETKPSAASTTIDTLITAFQAATFINQNIVLHAQLTLEDDTPNEVETSIHREMIYAIEHAIHHMAILKIAIKILALPIDVPATFGVAPSTLRHQHNVCAQ